jgi:hypothetical protein
MFAPGRAGCLAGRLHSACIGGVVLVLMYLRQKVPQTVLADLHGVSQPTVSRIYGSIMPQLDQVLCLHEPELTSVFVNREVLVDGTLVPPGTARTASTTIPANVSART